MNFLDLSDQRDRTLHGILRRQAEAIPDATYLWVDDEKVSFAEVEARATAWAAALRGLGVQRGDSVAFLLRSCPEFVYATFGCLQLGAIWIPVNVDYRGAWLRATLEDAAARVLVVDAELCPRVAEVAAGLPFQHAIALGDASRGALPWPTLSAAEVAKRAGKVAAPEDPGTGAGDTACVLWTSGTTGRSKGVMQSHNVWIRGALSGAQNSGIRDGDVLYGCLPMYNSAAWVAHIYRALVAGIPVGLDPAFSVQTFWDRVRHYGATQIFTLGTMHIYLWQAPERADDARNPVRHAGCVPMPDPLIDPFKKRFGIETLDQGYGQSEVLGMLHRYDTLPRKPGSLGQPLPGLEVALLDDDDRPVAPGEVGEFCCRPTEPNTLFSGYWKNPEATVTAWRNLWYHTGDLGRRDEDGDWFFVDRKKDYIRHKGRNMSSFEIERAIAAHPAVSEAAAIGIPDPALPSEAELMVFAKLKDGQRVEPAELARFVNDNAPYFFVPRYLEIVGDLPHTPTGRVQKFALRERGVGHATWDRVAAGFEVRR
ncbi:MAG: AMP-binding protein [Deltaproteobacteria bacterium]|nr:MAG: AMP-binding protein [Deltaproteobacteria bacterium]